MPTLTEAQDTYRAAREALREIAFSLDSTDRQAEEARLGMIALTTNYVGKLIEEFEARTAQFQSFVDDMNELIRSMGSGGATQAIGRLQTITDTAAGLINAGLGEVATRTLRGPAATQRALTLSESGELVVHGTGEGAVTVLCVHGVGHKSADTSWQSIWAQAIARGVRAWRPGAEVRCRFAMYDDLFDDARLSAGDVLQASAQLLGSTIWHGIGDLFRRRGGLARIPDRVRWTAGMVVQWTENKELRAALRKRIEESILAYGEEGPTAIAAHSLGSLVTYDTLASLAKAPDQNARTRSLAAALTDTRYVVFGSQIGNPAVRQVYGGRLLGLPIVRRWFHLYNRHDDVLTARIHVASDQFSEVDTEFDLRGAGDHDAAEYLGHAAAVDSVWRDVAAPRARGLARVEAKLMSGLSRKVRRRALLVGINEYPDPSMRLDGCVNDVFTMSAVLQEMGFQSEDIRVVLNDRATADGVRSRIDWLLDGVRDVPIDERDSGDDRVLYFSGHGAQISGYGVGETVDRLDECLVTHDFDWSREHAITDDELYDLYSQLPYGTRFMMILDCCHSGGMTRDGTSRIRGINPPDDIRHRLLRWNSSEGMWQPREVADRQAQGDRQQARIEKALLKNLSTGLARGELGRANQLRAADFEARAKAYGHVGPYMPVIFQACQESEYAYEYRHGVTSHGAFTFALAQKLREARTKKEQLTFEQLIASVGATLKALGYQQTPKADGPSKVLAANVPYFGTGAGRGGGGKQA